MYEELVRQLRKWSENYARMCGAGATTQLVNQAADAIEELSKRINRAVELYDRGVERSAMYEALKGISPEPPKEEE